MKFKELEEESIGCSVRKCKKQHLACCYNCPERVGCPPETMCEIYFLNTKQPFDLRERTCPHLTKADRLIWGEMFRRETVL